MRRLCRIVASVTAGVLVCTACLEVVSRLSPGSLVLIMNREQIVRPDEGVTRVLISISVWNYSTRPLTITGAGTSCSCVTEQQFPRTIPPFTMESIGFEIQEPADGVYVVTLFSDPFVPDLETQISVIVNSDHTRPPIPVADPMFAAPGVSSHESEHTSAGVHTP